MRKAFLITLLCVVLSHPLPSEAQVEVGAGYHYARSIPQHGAAFSFAYPVATRGPFTLRVRGEAGYGQETITYDGWDLYRTNRAWTAGGGPVVGLRLGRVDIYGGAVTGFRWFTDEIDIQLPNSTARAPLQEAPQLSVNAPGRPAAPALSLIGFEEGRKVFVSGLAGITVNSLPVVAPFIEYRWWNVFRWNEASPRNPFHGFQVGVSANLL